MWVLLAVGASDGSVARGWSGGGGATVAESCTRFSSSRCIWVPVAIATLAICCRSPNGNFRKIVTSPASISSTL